jgi:hypothetical protein
VNEVEPAPIAESIEIVTQPGLEGFALKRLESGDAEHRVIKIPTSGSILKPASGIPLVFEETADEIGRFTQKTRGEAGNLKHLDAQTHGVSRRRGCDSINTASHPCAGRQVRDAVKRVPTGMRNAPMASSYIRANSFDF